MAIASNIYTALSCKIVNIFSPPIRSGCEAQSEGEVPLTVVRKVAVSSPGQLIQRSGGQTSRWPLESGRYTLTLLPQFHSRGRFLLIPALWVFKETPRGRETELHVKNCLVQ